MAREKEESTETGMRCTFCGEDVLTDELTLLPRDPKDRRRYHYDCAPLGGLASGALYVMEDS